MKYHLKPIFTLAALALLSTTSVQAASEDKIVIALKTDSFELTETDISTLAIGESQTIETDSGTVIDLLRTADGAEIYVDGELLDIDFEGESLHEDHMIRKHVEVICDSDDECEEMVWASDGEDFELDELHEMHMQGEGHKVIVIKKEIVTQD